MKSSALTHTACFLFFLDANPSNVLIADNLPITVTEDFLWCLFEKAVAIRMPYSYCGSQG